MSKEKEADPLKNRAGHFALTTMGGEIFDNPDQREELRLIMESIVVIQAVHVTGLDQLSYVALCEQFEPLEKGSEIPHYLPMFFIDEEGNRSIVWEKAQDYINLKNQNIKEVN